MGKLQNFFFRSKSQTFEIEMYVIDLKAIMYPFYMIYARSANLFLLFYLVNYKIALK